MKLKEMNQNDADRLRFEARDLLTDVRDEIIPNAKQMHALRCRGFVIGKEGSVLRLSASGRLRECANGIPCTYFCEGFSSGKCTETEFPSCGIADGACLFTGIPCNKYCVQSQGG